MSNVTLIDAPYFDNLREIMRHAETLGEIETCFPEESQDEHMTSTRLYERDALENFIGEASCVIAEARKRIRYLETILAKSV